VLLLFSYELDREEMALTLLWEIPPAAEIVSESVLPAVPESAELSIVIRLLSAS
jgi:hypothetical protein